MSSLITITQAKSVALDFLNLVSTDLETHILGSIRRGRDLVKDVEVIFLCPTPTDKAQLWARLDTLVNQRRLHKNPDNPKWGDTYRSALFHDVTFDLFTADTHNYGYIMWLRTGPGDLNHWTMTQLAKHKSAVRVQGGHVWHVSYQLNHPDFDFKLGYAKLNKLRVPDEWTFFTLLGLPYVDPAHRTKITYGRLNRGVNTPNTATLKTYYVREQNAPQQKRLF